MNGSNTDKQHLGDPGQTEAGTQPASLKGAVTYDSDSLFRGRVEVAIRHDGSVYRLRITRQGKLILNK